MKKLNKDIGYNGERCALDFLSKEGYKILKKNYICKLGEIDYIATKSEILIFGEIKSRYSLKFGMPSEAVTYHKIKQIKKIAKYFLLQNNITEHFIRFDIVEVFFNNENNNYECNIIKDAFR